MCQKNLNLDGLINLCRLCLIRDETLHPIFDPLQDGSNETHIIEKIATCLPVHVRREDIISKKLCYSCIIKIEEFYEFWINAAESQVLLENLAKELGNEIFDTDEILSDKYSSNTPDASVKSFKGNPENELNNFNHQGELTTESIGDGTSDVVALQPEPLIYILESKKTSYVPKEGPPKRRPINPTPIQERILKPFERKETFICEYCSKDCKIKSYLDVHVRRHTGERPFKCGEVNCGKAFFTKSNLRTHTNNCHTIGEPYKCVHCERTFKTATRLRAHSRVHSDQKYYQCDYCNYTTCRKKAVEIHVRRHTNNYVSICDTCGKGFFSSFLFKEHLAMHAGLLIINCKECNEKFANYNALQAHKNKEHRKFKPFELTCKECGKMCTSRKSLRNHIKRDHLGEKYQCNECGVCVSTKSYLIIHLRYHSGKKPYKCKLCKKRFISKRVLKQHSVVHTRAKNYICHICNKRYSQKSTLNTHNKKIHPDLFNITVAKYAKTNNIIIEKKEEIIYNSPFFKEEIVT